MCHNKKKQKVVLLSTGGTIAGAGDAGRMTGYKSGVNGPEKLIETVPGLEELADIEVIQICNINSDDINDEIWLRLARTINERAADSQVAGFVITHGTDTLEETAYFLQLTVKTDKPVVVTGAMRPATAMSADGPMNLYQAVVTAVSKESVGRGVLVVFANQIYSARYIAKSDTTSVMAIAGGAQGAMGTVVNDEVFYFYHIDTCHTSNTEFDINSIDELGKVGVVYFTAGQGPDILNYAADKYEAIVVAGAGMGEYSEAFIKEISNVKIPVIVSSRVANGIITKDSLLNKNTVTAYNLSPQKATVLLRLALAAGKKAEDLQELFFRY